MSDTPRSFPGAPGNTHHPATGPLSHEQIAALRCRPEHRRTTIPPVGDVVGYRHVVGGPVVPALVTEVDDGAPPGGPHDVLMWRVITGANRLPVLDALGRQQHEPVPDPWPSVVLRVDPVANERGELKGPRRFVQTRESRLAGEPGWLPTTEIDWRR